ncbi:MAG: DEAD/DEAH box helicase [Rhodospirillales bacterium]
MTQFADLGLSAPLLEVLAAERYTTPTPIQAQAIPHILAGRDLLGIAQTGTGKTAAFALPVLHRLDASRCRAPRRGCRVLVLAPTRELASQIDDAVRTYGRGFGVTSAVVFGGVGATPQIRKMAGGVDFLVATPGRLLDHMQQGNIRLDGVEVLVLDEVDRMLDMGFIAPVRRIVGAIPARRQTLLFSATMPDDIRKFAAELLDDPVEVTVTPPASTVELIDQRVIHVAAREKPALLARLMSDRAIARALVFTRTKRGADRVTRHLAAAGVAASAIHGNKSQGQREQALAAFRSGSARVLVATDIAARGIDVDGITHVINFELPNIPESYVHRIGRTARAGAAGSAISFCDAEEREHLRGIESLIRRRLPAERHGAEPHTAAEASPAARPMPKPMRGAHAKPAQTKTAQVRSQPAKSRPAKAPAAKPAGAAKAPPKRAAQGKPDGGAAVGRKASTEAEPGKRADQPLRRLDGIGRVAAAPDGQARHDLSHLSFLAPAGAPAPAMKMARAGSR